MAISVEEARAMTEEQLQETITEIAFEIIANVGAARGMYIEAIQEAKAGNFDRAKELMAQGKETFVLGHHGHADGQHSPAHVGRAQRRTVGTDHADRRAVRIAQRAAQ